MSLETFLTRHSVIGLCVVLLAQRYRSNCWPKMVSSRQEHSRQLMASQLQRRIRKNVTEDCETNAVIDVEVATMILRSADLGMLSVINVTGLGI